MPRLFVLSGPEIGRTFDVEKTAVLGRAPTCEVRLRHSSVSREHARLEHVAGVWAIVDLDSRNGLHVDGRRVGRAELEDGGTFTLGQLELRFRLQAEATAPRVTPASPESAATARVEPVEVPAPREPAAREPAAREPAAREPAAEPVAAPAGAPDGDIVLEGDWEEPESGPALASLGSTTAVPPRAASPPPRSDEAAARAAARREAAAPAARGAAEASRRADLVGGRPVLQYSRVTDRRGFFSEELSQQPAWIRAGVYLLGAALFAGVVWAAFKLTTSVRGRASESAVESSE